MMSGVTLPLAFAAGLLAFISPCFLPLVPVMLTYLARDAASDREPTRWTSLTRAAWFVAAFTVAFCALWLAVGSLGPLVTDVRTPLRIGAGIVVIILGFHVTGLITIPLLERTIKADVRPSDTRPGWVSAILLGLAFAIGWTPCIGPVLGAIIALAATTGSLARGMILLVAFSLGLGLPFLATAAGLGASGRITGWLKRHAQGVSWVTGILLVVTGFLIMTDALSWLSRFIPALGPWEI